MKVKLVWNPEVESEKGFVCLSDHCAELSKLTE